MDGQAEREGHTEPTVLQGLSHQDGWIHNSEGAAGSEVTALLVE